MTKSTIHCLYLTKLCKWCFPSYPTGNFGRNQLLDCSSGLSPLYSTQTSDLHVSIVSRSSTRVSSGFNQFKYSSQSFGSQHNNLSPLQNRRIHKISSYEGFVFTKQSAFSGLHVCYYTRLLGSCYKTSERRPPKIPCQENLENLPKSWDWKSPHFLIPSNFAFYFTLFSWVLFTFPSQYLYSIGLLYYF